jgi:hypothetical protein
MQIVHLSLCLALALSAEAFAPNMPSRFSGTAIYAAKDKPLTELCEITKEACDVVSPMLNGTLRV